MILVDMWLLQSLAQAVLLNLNAYFFPGFPNAEKILEKQNVLEGGNV